MIESLMNRQKVAQAMEKLGGRFKLVALIHQRTREIVKNSEKPSDYDINKLHDMVLDEIIKGDLYLEEEEKE